MRQKYDQKVIIPTLAKGIQAQKNLLDFSRACKRDSDHPNFVDGEDDEEGESDQQNYEAELTQAQQNPALQAAFQEYPELRELCVATGIFMQEVRNALRAHGKDYSLIDYNNYHQTASMTGGDLFYSDLSGPSLGVYRSLGLWPMKTAAIYAMNAPYPFFTYRGMLVPIRRYSRDDGLYSLSTLYPFEYNTAVKSGVINNMEISQDPRSESDSDLLNKTIATLGWSLLWQYYGNDVSRFSNLSDHFEMIRNQTQFRLSVNPIIIEKVPDDKRKDYTKQLKASAYNTFTRKSEPLDSIYITENYKAVGYPPKETFIYPATTLNVYNASSAYYVAYRLSYEPSYGDLLYSSSVKSELYKIYNRIVESCIVHDGENRNGLQQFFTTGNDNFRGFYWPDNVHSNTTDRPYLLHRDSIGQAFQEYYNSPLAPDARPETCL
ncbi:MAG: hypothetical protein AAF202_11225, partial [Pseudomonadota bacterium]